MKIASNELVTEIQTSPNLRNVTLLTELVAGEATHFPSKSEATMIGRAAHDWLDGYRDARRNPFTPVADYPDQAELINLHDRLCALVTARQKHSDTLAPLVEPSVSVTLWGTAAASQNQAGIEAMKALNLGANDITLVDRTSVATAEAVGTRYVFRAVSA